MQTTPETHAKMLQERAFRILKTVIDPELYVNIIDLGLVYGVVFAPGLVQVKMTLSTPHCPLGEAIVGRVDEVISGEFPDREAVVTLVWEPAWTPERITEAGKRAL